MYSNIHKRKTFLLGSYRKIATNDTLDNTTEDPLYVMVGDFCSSSIFSKTKKKYRPVTMTISHSLPFQRYMKC